MLRVKVSTLVFCFLFVGGVCLANVAGMAQENKQENKQEETKKTEQKKESEQKTEEKTQEKTEEKKAEEKSADEKQDAEKKDQAKTGDDATGDDATGKEATEGSDEANDFDSLMKQWGELNIKMDETRKRFDESDVPPETSAIRDEFVKLTEQADALILKIKTAAISELESGNKDQKIIETIVGIMINDASFDRDIPVLETGQALIENGVDPKYFGIAQKAQRLRLAGKELFQELELRQKEFEADDLPRVKFTTNKGDIVLELYENEAPQTVGNFVSLIEDGYYDGIKFHRVIEGFMAQTGDPKTKDDSKRNEWGSGGPGYNIYCECYKPEARRHFTGSLSMAKQQPRDTGGSQFYIAFARTSHLDGRHTVFGRVVEGMDIVNSIQRINPDQPSDVVPDVIQKAEVIRKRDHEYVPTKVEN